MSTSKHTNHCYSCGKQLGPVVVHSGGSDYCDQCARLPTTLFSTEVIRALQERVEALEKDNEFLMSWLKSIARPRGDQPNTLTAEQVERLRAKVERAISYAETDESEMSAGSVVHSVWAELKAMAELLGMGDET